MLMHHNFKPCSSFPSLMAVQKLRCVRVFVCFDLAVVQYCFYELSRNQRKYVSEASLGDAPLHLSPACPSSC